MKKMKKKYLFLAAALSLGIAACGAARLTEGIIADAGSITVDVLDNSFLKQAVFTAADWKEDGDIVLEGGKAVFTALSQEEATLLYRTEVALNEDNDSFVLETKIGVNEIDSNRRFGIAFGFDRIRYTVGDENTTFAYVTKGANGNVFGLCHYNDDCEKTELMESYALSGQEWTVKIVAKKNSVQIFVDGVSVFDGEIGGYAGGYFGISATAEIGATTKAYVSDMKVTNDYYDLPETPNIYDTFEDESLNTAIWNLYNDAPYLAGVAETGGRLRFIDSNGSTVTTKYRYSNFEMSFDVPWVKRTVEYLPDGNMKSPATSWFGVFCGIDLDDYSGVSTVDKLISNNESYFLSFSSDVSNGVPSGNTTVLFGPDSSRVRYPLPESHNLWNLDNEGRNFNVKFTCVDGVYNLDVKWEDETEWYHVFTKNYTMKSGYISFTGYGNGGNTSVYKANFDLDNIKITNRDYNGKVIDVGVSSNNIPNPGDFGYADSKDPNDLLTDGTDFDEGGSEDGCGSVLTGAESILLAGAIGGIAMAKKKRGKDE